MVPWVTSEMGMSCSLFLFFYNVNNSFHAPVPSPSSFSFLASSVHAFHYVTEYVQYFRHCYKGQKYSSQISWNLPSCEKKMINKQLRQVKIFTRNSSWRVIQYCAGNKGKLHSQGSWRMTSGREQGWGGIFGALWLSFSATDSK